MEIIKVSSLVSMGYRRLSYVEIILRSCPLELLVVKGDGTM